MSGCNCRYLNYLSLSEHCINLGLGSRLDMMLCKPTSRKMGEVTKRHVMCRRCAFQFLECGLWLKRSLTGEPGLWSCCAQAQVGSYSFFN